MVLIVSLTPYGRQAIGGDTKHTSLYFKVAIGISYLIQNMEVLFCGLDDFTTKHLYMFGVGKIL